MNSGRLYRGLLPPRAAGVTLVDWLVAEYEHSSREEWSERVAIGRVTLDGDTARADQLLRAGMDLAWSRPPWTEPDVPLRFDVAFSDPHLLIVNKPSGLPTLPGGEFNEHTLLRVVQQAHGAQWSPMHRLGRGTSGLVVFASEAAAEVARTFREHEMEKRYLARATPGLVPQTITAPIGRLPNGLHAVTPGGRFAQTIVEAVGELSQIRIVTGRPHQIRIHLAHVGHPLLGDPLYTAHGLLDARPGDLGYWLHAWRLGFRHPVTGARVQVEAAPPAV